MSTTPRATWYFDFISPFAFLQWRRLRELQARLPIEPVPILFAVVLDRIGQKGPAEIPGKRVFTYRHVIWRARREGIPLRFPPAHPFNPLAMLRLSIALGNRPEVIDALFDHLWVEGRVADTAEALEPVARRFGVDAAVAIADPAVKDTLKRNTEAALAAGVFGVPTLAFGEELFWGDDATDMALDYAEGRLDLGERELARIAELPATARRI
jgi:2-hydroxychromene-2-carboxylate isomerase